MQGGEKNSGTMYLGYVKKERKKKNVGKRATPGGKKMLRTIISVIITWSNIPVILTRPIDWDVKESGGGGVFST